MCGIVGLVLNPEATAPDAGPAPEALQQAAADGAGALEAVSPATAAKTGVLDAMAAAEQLGRQLVHYTGFRLVVRYPALREAISALADTASTAAGTLDAVSDDDEAAATLAVRLRDLAWRIREDVLAQVPRVLALAGVPDELTATAGALAIATDHPLLRELWRVDVILQNLARLEVRGRDSGGLGVLVCFADADARSRFDAAVAEAGLADELARRLGEADFVSGAIVSGPAAGGGSALAFTHKVAREVGELGQNVADLRDAIAADGLLRVALTTGSTVDAFAHTRWASNGVISQPNAHPLSSETTPPRADEPLTVAALNGDIDNFVDLAADLKASTGRAASPRITTDAKLIPLTVSAGLAGEHAGDVPGAFRAALARFEGSTAIVAQSSAAPGLTCIALNGSGQALYVGLTDEGWIYASELYAVVERTNRMVQLDGRVGEVVVLDASAKPGTLIEPERIKQSEITTADIDRAGHQHFLLKEIREAPRSVRRTLRGRLGERSVRLPESSVPAELLSRIEAGNLRRVLVVGQGTAAVAGRGIAAVMVRDLSAVGVTVEAMLATELSGYRLGDVGPGTLVVAVSQSGTTTDTNRAVDMAKDRGAVVIGVVNRRGSDLTTKAHGVVYTSDGRDVEMSVASTKAFYCQVVAGALLSLFLADRAKSIDPDSLAARVEGMRELPGLLERTLEACGSRATELADRVSPTRRYYAVVGSGPAAVAAEEVRIKISELCYRSVAVDSVEDKKHIDLSAEPMILICAAGLGGSALADAVKEAVIFSAHRAATVVIAGEGEAAARFGPGVDGVLPAPEPRDVVGEILVNTAAGHLFSYRSARAIDATSILLRQIREHVEHALEEDEAARDGTDAATATESEIAPLVREFDKALRARRYRAALEPDTATNLSLLFRYALGRLPLEDLEADTGIRGGMHEVLMELRSVLTIAIDETRRTIDAVKHQAKTVTVGTTRAEEPIEGAIGDEIAAAGLAITDISPRDLAALRSLSPAIESVEGSTRYALSGLDALGQPVDNSRIVVERKNGVAEQMPSRADSGTVLAGRKRLVVRDRRLFLGTGGHDGRTIAMVPLLDRSMPTGLLLLHVAVRERVPRAQLLQALLAMGTRYDDLRQAVAERDVTWDDRLLDQLGARASLLEPVEALADRAAALA